MTKSILSISNEMTISRREVLTFAASSFVAIQMPWLARDFGVSIIMETGITTLESG
jgi:hypothetical protein